MEGSKQSEINYIRGRQIGTVKVWDKEGNITFEDYTPASTEIPATSEKSREVVLLAKFSLINFHQE